MTWENRPLILTLDMDHLSGEDLVDIKNITNPRFNIDLYKTFMRIPPEKRGMLSGMIYGCYEHFTDIPPYGFYNYKGFFLHKGKPIGDIGGGRGFGGYRMEEGTLLWIGPRIVSIGDHAFDGCKNLTDVRISGDVFYIGHKAFSNIPGLTINCILPQKPDTWADDWCDEGCTVNWGV